MRIALPAPTFDVQRLGATLNVLVTGAGGAAGVCVIKSLKGRYRLVGTDIDPLAAGLYLSDRAYVTRGAGDRRFVDQLLRIGRKERARVLIPTVQEELLVLARHRERFERAGIVPVLSGIESLKLATSKERTYRFFRDEPYGPKLFDAEHVEFPAVVKPVASRGTRGFWVCHDADELRMALQGNRRHFERSLVMEYVPGTEYSVYGVSGPDARPRVVVPVRRIQAVSESKKAEVVADRRLQDVASEVVRRLGLVGPWNVQLMRKGRRITLIEVNPRFAGTTSLVVAAGVNLPVVAVKLALGERIARRELAFRDGLMMTRYNEEIFLSPRQVLRPPS